MIEVGKAHLESYHCVLSSSFAKPSISFESSLVVVLSISSSTLLVTGGCGFIGSNFIRHVIDRYPTVKVINLDALTYAGNPTNLEGLSPHADHTLVRGDIADRELVNYLMERYAIDHVVHFAAESHVDRSIEDSDDFIRTNIVGTHVLLEACRLVWGKGEMQSPRFLHVSTDEVFGSLGEDGLFTEETPYDPRSPYSASKAASDHLVRAYHHTYGLPTLITNCSNNYGPYQFPEKLIPLMINNARNGRSLPVYGDGKNVRDWLHVEDHCSALLTVLEEAEPGAYYNIGGNAERRNIEVVQTICDTIDEVIGLPEPGQPRRELIAFVTDRAGHDRRYAIDASLIKKDLGWTPTISFEDGIRSTIEWYLANESWIGAIEDGSYQTAITG